MLSTDMLLSTFSHAATPCTSARSIPTCATHSSSRLHSTALYHCNTNQHVLLLPGLNKAHSACTCQHACQCLIALPSIPTAWLYCCVCCRPLLLPPSAPRRSVAWLALLVWVLPSAWQQHSRPRPQQSSASWQPATTGGFSHHALAMRIWLVAVTSTKGLVSCALALAPESVLMACHSVYRLVHAKHTSVR